MNQRSNSGAVWLAAGVLGTVAFAAVALEIQDHYSMKVNWSNLQKKPGQPEA
jgi:hypothetical protein